MTHRPGPPEKPTGPPATAAQVVRVAAAADLHLHREAPRRFRNAFRQAATHADVLLLAGDLTQSGTVEQAHMVAEDAAGHGVPVIAVAGNHDHDSRQIEKVTGVLTDAGIQVLEGSSTVITTRSGVRLGIAGCKGYGGGFAGAVVHEHGEPQTRAFVRHSRTSAQQLAAALSQLDADLTLAVTHYAPTADTLAGEPRELYLMLGSERLGKVIDAAGVALAVHGHAHHGKEKGATPAGIPVRNVAYKVIGTAYRIYTLRPAGRDPSRWQLVDHPDPRPADPRRQGDGQHSNRHDRRTHP
jgi:Icc-related predicted phosphoesterase